MRQVWNDRQNDKLGIELVKDCSSNKWEVILYSMYGKTLEKKTYFSKSSAQSAFYRMAKNNGIEKR